MAFAAANERAAFLKKVYSILLAGILGFAATLRVRHDPRHE